MRRGETVTLGGTLKVDQRGIACTKLFSLPWESISGTEFNGAAVVIYQKGAEKPLASVPMYHPNAGLIPALFDAVRS